MTQHDLHWQHGVFLRPHHFQSANRRVVDLVKTAQDWVRPYSYGLYHLQIDIDALAGRRLLVPSCHIRLRDGTHLRCPEDANLAPVAIPDDVFTRESNPTVYIAVPRLGRHVDANDGSSWPRYSVKEVETEDENGSGDRQTLRYRVLNAKLVIGEQEASGHDALPIFRIRRGTTAEAPPEIDPGYIPPLLSCNAWPGLMDFITRIYDRLSGSAERLSSQIIDRGVNFETGHREDLGMMMKLQAVNSSLGIIRALPFIQGTHPLEAYRDLCKVVGNLAYFRDEKKFPDEIPGYDHDNLALSFFPIQNLIPVEYDARPDYQKREFKGAGKQMKVRMESEWLEPQWAFYIGVQARLKPNEVESLLREALDMKVGSAEEVDTLYRFGRAGVKMNRVTDPPRILPLNNWTYWQIDRASDSWKDVEASLNLGIRINENQVASQIDGQQEFEIRYQEDQVQFRFTLYAIPTKK